MVIIKRNLLLAMSILAMLVMAACGNNQDEGTTDTTDGPGEVVATVNGEEVYERDLMLMLQQQLGMFGIDIEAEENQEIVDQFKPMILDQLVLERILVQEANTQNIEIPEEEVDIYFEQMRSQAQLPEGETFEDVLAAQGYTEEQLRLEIEEMLMVENLLRLEHLDTSDYAVTEEETREYYDELLVEYGDELEEFEVIQDELALSLKQGKYIEDLQARAEIETFI
ncbi:putative membrane protein [Evansella vedderi]|uniref:Membrane protein n=1 Tax=Evansella vedderi TaxID=38282 RepID=A0ABU0A2G5_9BACI|nr:SurA N-terminal domain-containing protein [Evansella vedderi]MDQ0257684.1 putative membrane protein [Evansella vedderi]